MRCAAASDGAAGRAGTAGTAAVIAADILATVVAGEMALPFTVAALGWTEAIPVAEPAWAAWAVAVEVVMAAAVTAAVVTVEAAAIVETSKVVRSPALPGFVPLKEIP